MRKFRWPFVTRAQHDLDVRLLELAHDEAHRLRQELLRSRERSAQWRACAIEVGLLQHGELGRLRRMDATVYNYLGLTDPAQVEGWLVNARATLAAINAKFDDEGEEWKRPKG